MFGQEFYRVLHVFVWMHVLVHVLQSQKKKESKHISINALMQTEPREYLFLFDLYTYLIAVILKTDKEFTDSWKKLYFGSWYIKVVLFWGKTRQQGAGMKQQQTGDAASFLVVPLRWGLQTSVTRRNTRTHTQTYTHTAAARMISHGVPFPPCVYQLTLRTWEREAEKIRGD